MRIPRRRAIVATLLLALPVVLFWVIAERASWRPHVLAHDKGADSLNFSPDGKMLASVRGRYLGSGCEVRLWDVSSRKLKRTRPCPPGSTSVVSFAPRGEIVAFSNANMWGDGKGIISTDAIELHSDAFGVRMISSGLAVRDARSGKVLHRFGGAAKSNRRYLTLALSPDRKTLAAAAGVIDVFDVASGRLLRTLRKLTTQSQAVAFSPDGGLLAAAGYNGVAVFDLHSGRTLWKQRTDRAALVAFSPDGRTLANTHADKTVRLSGRIIYNTHETVRLRDARSGKLQRITPMLSNNGAISAIAFSPDGKKLASGNGSGKVELWDLQTTRALRTFQGKFGPTALAFSPDGATLATADVHEIKLWRIK